ncbi:small RNA 2'-O-methyltransferase-like isoform X1 [Haliotis rubra]|uniref:small RNA 2'-O-methyltransferase-like isoform X1 n=1 Tax=Haliotis rubra TaxID=36100 RepID=UPI001EE51DF6|nr:small RNA 2'-O-methyltransferase-like isoform X1 [Haliotis rubra]
MTTDARECQSCCHGNRDPGSDVSESAEIDGGPKFVPQLYVQRYSFVRNVLHQHLVTSVADIGCGECRMVTLLKTVPCMESISLVDLDKRLLESKKDCIRPLIFDYLHQREKPLCVRLFHGDATELDSRLQGCQAVTMVEFIEHLVPSDLQKVIERVFGDLGPRLVVMTTPNAEFNVLFPNFTGFRHWDHKFEWSRTEFQSWCGDICDKYQYNVTYDGVGNAPESSAHVGHCSQAAIFTRTPEASSAHTVGSPCYTLIAECDHPYKENKSTVEDRLALEVQYHIRQLTLNSDLDENEGHYVIAVEKLFSFRPIKNICDIDKLRSYLHSCYTLTDDGENVLVPHDDSDDDLERSWGEGQSWDSHNVMSQNFKEWTETEEAWD